ncbi:MAG TPA: DNA polymerase III subunit delta [Chloroflexota bacterium]|nr:DNA polymerase III subunit delta [Chloroflexota bacterium]
MIYLFHGPDSFSMDEALQRLLRGALPPETADLNLTRMAAGQVGLDALRFACEAMPFLAERRAVVVEHIFSRATSRRTREARERQAPGGTAGDSEETEGKERPSGLAAEVAAYLPQVPSSTLLVFVETDAPPKTGPLARALEAAKVKQQYFPTLAGAPLLRWIKERVAASEASISDRAAAMLADFAGGDLRALSNELAKLVTYVGPGRAIDVADVQLLVGQVSEANIFECVDAIATGNRTGALRALHVLFEHGERPERILAMVTRQVRLLLQANDLTQQGEAPEVIGRALGLSPFPLRKVLEQVRHFSAPTLHAMHRRALEADLHLKTGQQEAVLALELLVAELASAAGRREPEARRSGPVYRRGR